MFSVFLIVTVPFFSTFMEMLVLDFTLPHSFLMRKEVYEYISRKTWDPIIEWRICRISWKQFAIFQSDKEFYEKVSPVFWWMKYLVPFPTLCPEERQRRRMLFRNETTLYKRVCDHSKKPIISIYKPDSEYQVYDQNYWWSDELDATQYWMEFDTDFMTQFSLLSKRVPHCSLYSFGNTNSEYSNFAINAKNCYLLFWWWDNEDCLYCDIISWWNNNVDTHLIFDSEYCYECINIKRCYNCFYTYNAENCSNCLYVEESYWCQDCIMCFGLSNKQYYFLNEFVWKEKIEELRKDKDYLKQLLQNYQEKYQLLISHKPRPAFHVVNSENSWWEGIYDSKNCFNWFNINNWEDSKHISFLHNIVSSQDIDYASPYWANYSYNWCSCTWTCNSIGNFLSIKNDKIFYCMLCHNSQHLFWCVWLKNKSYCIYNKQYTKEEYEQLVPQLITRMQENDQWWEFLDPSLSPFGYNETVAQEYHPLTKEEALEKWYSWQDKEYPINVPEWITTLPAQELPHFADDVDDDIVHVAILCSVSWKPFRFLKQELAYYRKHNISLPRKHPDVRHKERLAKRTWRELHVRNCDATWEQILSVHPQDAQFKVYSENAYRQEVFW